MNELLSLPIGIQNFTTLRQRNKLYVDKTDQLMRLADTVERCFLSRPRRFGKSLTLSTLEAMFQGKFEIFKGLAAEEWVKEQSKNPSPVLRLDMSGLQTNADAEALSLSIRENLMRIAQREHIPIISSTLGGVLQDLISGLHDSSGTQAVVLIDEYDKPILDNIDDLKKADEMRAVLQSFYTIIKSCDEHIRFLMLTGISKFTKMGIFSGMNNLNDISMDRDWSSLVGYTQRELEDNFADWLDQTAQKMHMDRGKMLERMKSYYDGFCFDGHVKLYNPFSIMQFLQKGEFVDEDQHSTVQDISE